MKSIKKRSMILLALVLLSTAVLSGCTHRDINGTTYLSAKGNPVDTEKLKEALSTAKNGDHVSFGAWEQNRWMDGEELISWTVIRQDVGRALLLSDYVIDRKKFEERERQVLWPDSTLREWLNGFFYETAFTPEERAMIQKTTNATLYYQDYQQYQAPSDDYVFPLSMAEHSRYVLRLGNTRYGVPCYNVLQKNYYKADIEGVEGVKRAVSWWLRDSGGGIINAASVNAGDGIHNSYGLEVGTEAGVRPALWIVYDEQLMNDYYAGKIEPNPDPELDAKLKNAAVGDVITFGVYDVNPSSKDGFEDLEWKVLEVQEDRLLVIGTKTVISGPMMFSSGATECDWESAELRKLMNTYSFLSDLFNPQELAKIQEVQNVTECSAKDPIVTKDWVFVPSEADIQKYFPSGKVDFIGNLFWLRNQSDDPANGMKTLNYDGSISDRAVSDQISILMMMWLKR